MVADPVEHCLWRMDCRQATGMEVGTLATVNFTVPNQEQAALLYEMGIDPDGYAIMTDNEDAMTARHLKTRHDIFISKNRRVAQNDNQRKGTT